MPSQNANGLKEISRQLPSLTNYAQSQDPTFANKNGLIKGLVELCGRLVASTFQCNIQPAQPCHYFHDLRFSKFTPEGVPEFATRIKSMQRIRDFRPILLVAILFNYSRIFLFLFPYSIHPRNGLLRLAMFDLACIWTLIKRKNISKFYFSASFQPYVFILCQLREMRHITFLAGIQHGAWAESSLQNATRNLKLDEYWLLHERFSQVFRTHFDRDSQVTLRYQTSTTKINWTEFKRDHIAVALQYDDDEMDLAIVKTCRLAADQTGVDLVVYPHPRMPSNCLDEVAQLGAIEPRLRFADSLCLVTRYSTLGMQFNIEGGKTIFVDCGQRIRYDTDGLDVTFVPYEKLRTTLLSSINGRMESTMAAPTA